MYCHVQRQKWFEALSDNKNALVHLRWENQGLATYSLKISFGCNFWPGKDLFNIFQVSFRARQLLKNSPSDAVQDAIKPRSRFERFNVFQKTNLPCKFDPKS